MQDYDTVLKLLLTNSAGCLLKQVTNRSILRWLNVDLPKAQQLRVDLLGQTDSGGLEHIELQSSNHPRMAVRMLEYRLGIYRQYGQFPRQTLLYVGREKLNMPNSLETGDLSFRYRLVNASDLDGNAMLESEGIGDNVLAILARVRNPGEAIRRILARVWRLEFMDRQDAIHQLLLISGLRALAQTVNEEVNKMPVTENILDHELIRPAYQKGLQEGRVEGERAVLRKQLEKRFGALSAASAAKLNQCSIEALDELGIGLLNAASLEELLP